MKQISIILLLLLGYTTAFAQGPEMDTVLRSNGKIYVVVVVIAIIFIGLALYLFAIDRRLKKIEKDK
ncbi:CcmD family protein [Mucilaginibacter ximonensis]|uniref:CcmD family protein n=1 Tax=Mucilaginibacter ximonensis TaxID=538021 RepID=A0ABW5Y7W3_9SPHI